MKISLNPCYGGRLEDQYEIDLALTNTVSFQSGEIVAWQYEHCLGENYTTITKFGEYIGRIRHTKRHTGDRLAMVHFEGNKRPSRVPLDDLYKTSKRSK